MSTIKLTGRENLTKNTTFCVGPVGPTDKENQVKIYKKYRFRQCCGSASKKCGCGSGKKSQCGCGSGCGFMPLLNYGEPSNSIRNL
jgi:hypothetical protein